MQRTLDRFGTEDFAIERRSAFGESGTLDFFVVTKTHRDPAEPQTFQQEILIGGPKAFEKFAQAVSTAHFDMNVRKMEAIERQQPRPSNGMRL